MRPSGLGGLGPWEEGRASRRAKLRSRKAAVATDAALARESETIALTRAGRGVRLSSGCGVPPEPAAGQAFPDVDIESRVVDPLAAPGAVGIVATIKGAVR